MTIGKKRLSISDVQYFAHTVRVYLFAHTDTVYENRTYSDSTFAHTIVSVRVYIAIVVYTIYLGFNFGCLKILKGGLSLMARQ